MDVHFNGMLNPLCVSVVRVVSSHVISQRVSRDQVNCELCL